MRRGPPRSSSGSAPSGRGAKRGGPKSAGPKSAGPHSSGPRAAGPKGAAKFAGPGRPNRGPARPTHEGRPQRPQGGPDPRAGTTSPRIALKHGKPLSGPWLWLTRPGSENDLSSELRLSLGEPAKVRELGAGLVRSELAATFDDGTLDATFARHALRIRRTLPHDAARIFAEVATLAEAGPIAFDVIVADSDEGNRAAGRAQALGDEVRARLAATGRTLVTRERARDQNARLVDVVLTSPSEAMLGEIDAGLALTLHAQGRARMKVAGDSPSRAARKVEEALDWLGLGPGPGEVCVDLGAAPGGWSFSLLERRARVIAVDPAELRPDVARHPRLTHVKASAFQYAPDEPVDWLFCDMAWRPREAAQMLAKWARRGWARFLVANLKLPMKTKAEMVKELREILHGGGWNRVRSRQLYHDRDEITVTAHR